MTGIITSSSKFNIGKNTVMEDMEDDVDELPDSYFSKAAARLFDKIDHGKSGVIPSSKFVDLIKTLWEGLHGDYLRVICRK